MGELGSTSGGRFGGPGDGGTPGPRKERAQSYPGAQRAGRSQPMGVYDGRRLSC